MGGEIGFSSKKNKGSTFWFTVPLTRSSKAAPQTKPTTDSEVLHGIKALVVDPHQISQTVTLNHLLEWKMKGTAVESAQEAMAFLRHEAESGHPCDLVLISSTRLDLSIDLARTITKDSNLPPTSLVLLTRTREKKRLEEARKAGFTTHLNRPVSGPRLQQSLISLFNPRTTADISAHETDRLPISETKSADNRPESGKSILLAEDNTIIQKMVHMQLNRLGYAVRIVANGKEAVQAAADGACSLVLMDCNMPVMDGFQAAREIRGRESKGQRIPIIAMTAGMGQNEEKQIKEAGMDTYLDKPIQIESLAEILEEWIPKVEPGGWMKDRSSSSNPIELNDIEANFGDDRSVLWEFLHIYQSSTEIILEKIKKNLEKKNRADLLENTQELRGSSANIGAVFMAGLCEHLEAEKDSSSWKRSQQIVDEMDAELKKISAFTKKLAAKAS